MRAIVVLFDSLSRRMLPAYGCEWVRAPNFERLAERSVVFDRCYGGSMPCIPARRELHTGRYNFLHRSWGPLEPFDDSVPELLGARGVHTHLISDHPQYWYDEGPSYATRYSTYEFERGFASDAWKAHLRDPPRPAEYAGWVTHQYWVNRHIEETAGHHQRRVFDDAEELLRTNGREQSWFLFVDEIDPHEPFVSSSEWQSLYPHEYGGPYFDYPHYGRVTETAEAIEHLRMEYAAVVSMCDASLGRVLDLMDEYRLWQDTMLIVCTDHGLLLGEQGWRGKCFPPWYDDLIHTPLFVWDPRSAAREERRWSLVQTIDLAPTLLEFFGLEPTPDMEGRSLRETIARDEPVREAGLFGMFGGHVCVTDGRHVYMRASKDVTNEPLFEYTLWPTRAFGRGHPGLPQAELCQELTFTKDLRTLRLPGDDLTLSAWAFGSLLFDLERDPGQEQPLRDDALELRIASLLVELMRANDAPADQFLRLGLPVEGEVGPEHLLVGEQWPQVESSRRPLPAVGEFPESELGVLTPVARLLAHPGAAAIVRRHAPRLADLAVWEDLETLTLYRAATMTSRCLRWEQLEAIAAELRQLQPPPRRALRRKGRM